MLSWFRYRGAERVVNGHRDRLDRVAAWGVPAHVTVLDPLLAPSAITATVITGLADAVGSVRAFDCEFALLPGLSGLLIGGFCCLARMISADCSPAGTTVLPHFRNPFGGAKE